MDLFHPYIVILIVRKERITGTNPTKVNETNFGDLLVRSEGEMM